MSEVTILNRTSAEIVLFADVVKSVKATADKPAHKTLEPVLTNVTRRNRGTGEYVSEKSNVITLPGMKRGSFEGNPVKIDASVWASIEKQAAVESLIFQGKIEVS